MFYKLSKKCWINSTQTHSCVSLHNNKLPNINQVSSFIESAGVLSSNMIDSWIQTGQYKTLLDVGSNTNNCKTGQILHNYLAMFSPCSALPLITIYIADIKLSCICDTGACRSLISSIMARHIWGHQCLTDLKDAKNYKLRDVNNKPLEILGYKNISFYINTINFQHDFFLF